LQFLDFFGWTTWSIVIQSLFIKVILRDINKAGLQHTLEGSLKFNDVTRRER
jgi:hypothetical protein